MDLVSLFLDAINFISQLDWWTILVGPAGVSLAFSVGGQKGSGSSSSGEKESPFPGGFLGNLAQFAPLPSFSNALQSGQAQVTNVETPFQPFPVAGQNASQSNRGLQAFANRINTDPEFAALFPRQKFTLGVPEFTPLEPGGFDKLEEGLFDRQRGLLQPQFEEIKRQINEEAALRGFGSSPALFAEGGARDIANRNFTNALRSAATEASLARLAAESAEAQRRTAFDQDLVRLFEDIFTQRANLTQLGLGTGGQSTQRSSGFNFGFL